ncbi:NAD(P)-binding protein [Aspergillus affinis]|uniref:NAD(P)-binding protein n=1 Tax=Aspergillus affinis TaxID=1070780 RepID=UPI0022FE3FEA|nr:NAD(P)-binding protein [Aspergillus affinis]KAI9034842.1 NAD(P)-binding protein [Aspergillus affinis]
MQKGVRSGQEFVDQLVSVNPTIIDTVEAHGVRSYIFAPCLVYSPGEGFGNKTSIQDVVIVKAAMKVRRVYKVDTENPAMTKALAKRNVIDGDDVMQADDEVLKKMGEALEVSPSMVPVLLGGMCQFTPEHGKQIG